MTSSCAPRIGSQAVADADKAKRETEERERERDVDEIQRHGLLGTHRWLNER
jgi:hypothetical protein